MIHIQGEKEEAVIEQGNLIFAELSAASYQGMEILEPQPDLIPKLRDQYRYCLMVKVAEVISSLPLIKKALKSVKRKRDVGIMVNIDE